MTGAYTLAIKRSSSAQPAKRARFPKASPVLNGCRPKPRNDPARRLSEEGHEISYVDVIESEKPSASRSGRHRGALCTAAARRMLAFRPKSVQTKYLAQTKFVKFHYDTSSKKSWSRCFRNPPPRRGGGCHGTATAPRHREGVLR